ncbi:MAG TPA: hypothetical protein DCW90_00285 [Lachnospiraceae bacterium]|nr:hypothetical protein [Lachnospiraceae bacterium]
MSWLYKIKHYVKHLTRLFILWLIGGNAYMIIELLYRQRTHWTMGIVGGLCFVLIGLINEGYNYDMSLASQSVIAATIVTIVEFISGCIINLQLGWNVWDYSNLPCNILGQICLPFYFLWMLLAPFAIILDDTIRWKLFDEERPKYHIF